MHLKHFKSIVKKKHYLTFYCRLRAKQRLTIWQWFEKLQLYDQHLSFVVKQLLLKTQIRQGLAEANSFDNLSCINHFKTNKGNIWQVITLTVRSCKEGEPPLEYCKVLNRLLPKNIRVVAWKQVPEKFSARFDCKKRTYRYFFPQGDLNLQVSIYYHLRLHTIC